MPSGDRRGGRGGLTMLGHWELPKGERIIQPDFRIIRTLPTEQKTCWVPVLGLPLTNCGTPGKSLSLSEPPVLHL